MRTATDRKYILTMKYPASWWKNKWRDALPAGNGRIGASVYGAVGDETVLINHAELWHWGRKDELPDVGYTLPETRRLMDEGRYMEANWHLTSALRQKGYATTLASPVPLAHLLLTMHVERAFRSYRRELDMSTGEIAVSWRDGGARYARRLFVSRADDLIAYTIEADQAAIDALLRLDFPPSDNPKWNEALEERRQTIAREADGEFLCYAAANEDGRDYGAVLRVVLADGEAAREGDGIRIRRSSRALVLVKPFANGERGRDWRRLREELSAIEHGYEQLLERHAALHGELFLSASLSLGASGAERERSNEELLLDSYEGEAPAALIEKLWAYGRYLYISATREDGPPMPLYGLWGGDYRLMWCHYMANENIQMMNWHAPVGGLVQLTKALFRHYDGLMDAFRDNARKLYGCRGIYIPAGTTPGIGSPNQIVPVILNWTGAAGWLARHYYEYFLFTGDHDFLRDTAMPFMREAAAFYEDFLVDDANGNYRMYPSVSPENTPGNHMPAPGEPLDHPMPTAIDATMDFAILKELLTNLIEAGRRIGADADDVERWERMLRRIPPYVTNEDGAVREWMHPDFDDRYDHRHLSHLYPVFPGREVTREDDPELFDAFEIAVGLRRIGAQTGWSLAHMAAIYARLGSGERAVEAIDLLARSCLIGNLFTLHNDWREMGVSMNKAQAPVQLDANLGVTNAVQEMLLYVSPRVVRLMPAVPERWSRGEAAGFRFCEGTVSFRWDRGEGRFEAELTAERAAEFTLLLPETFDAYRVSGEAGTSVAAVPNRSAAYRISMQPGRTLRIRAE
ncbi:glycosyl hydrolase family 95 catalytic domain-containing protein [Paenibacillus sp.]|uniref:glycosyl hydrolase family 95 catalytic domain-containing protein n=1 Tax=Paenibacillus sp. TaxID=58172 RepID=UPI002D4BAECB|nr:glycoside hydrolase N-terminal domain-containing protein [Paenibacillus sp.]HZG87822.1 glycoside hydrolase N-terminal domain-containing protein [Paenibacillus sp.]